jgi:hypothetical protein
MTLRCGAARGPPNAGACGADADQATLRFAMRFNAVASVHKTDILRLILCNQSLQASFSAGGSWHPSLWSGTLTKQGITSPRCNIAQQL